MSMNVAVQNQSQPENTPVAFEVGKTYADKYNQGFRVIARTPCFVTVEVLDAHSEVPLDQKKYKVRGKSVEFFEMDSYGYHSVRAENEYVPIEVRRARAKAEQEAKIKAARDYRMSVGIDCFHGRESNVSPDAAVHWIMTDDIPRIVSHANMVGNGGCMIAIEGGSRDYTVWIAGYELSISEFYNRKTGITDRFVQWFHGHGISASRAGYRQGGKWELETRYPEGDGRYMDEDGVYREACGAKFQWATPE